MASIPITIPYISLNDGVAAGSISAPVALDRYSGPEDWYRFLGCNYPKFFKMDVLSKWAWMAAEMLLISPGGGARYEAMDRRRIAVVLATTAGCIDVDHRYLKSTESIPSPALFVYTLPNIMLGEICIRHGFQGEQLCLVQEAADPEALHDYAAGLLNRPHTDACLYGHVDAAAGTGSAALHWLSRPQ